jgi:hypothetical protein
LFESGDLEVDTSGATEDEQCVASISETERDRVDEGLWIFAVAQAGEEGVRLVHTDDRDVPESPDLGGRFGDGPHPGRDLAWPRAAQQSDGACDHDVHGLILSAPKVHGQVAVLINAKESFRGSRGSAGVRSSPEELHRTLL